jgi:hypothetical protein
MTGLDIFKQKLYLLRPFLMTGSIDEGRIKFLKPTLDQIITFIASPIFDEMRFEKIQRVTVNKNLFNGANERINDINLLKYPPAKFANYGRANIKGQSILYATCNPITALNEIKPNVGDLITVSTWTILENETLSVVPIFKITSKDNISHNELSLNFLNEYEKLRKTLSKEVAEQSDELILFIAECFAKKVEYGNKYDYFMSAYFANRIFTEFNIEALVYPSFPDKLVFSNIAIQPQSFDNKYSLSNVEECFVIESPRENGHFYNLKRINSTKEFHKGKILW